MSSNTGPGTIVGFFLGAAGIYGFCMLAFWIVGALAAGIIVLIVLGVFSIYSLVKIAQRMFSGDFDWLIQVGIAMIITIECAVAMDLLMLAGPAQALAENVRKDEMGIEPIYGLTMLMGAIAIGALAAYFVGLPVSLYTLAMSDTWQEMVKSWLIPTVLVIVAACEVFRQWHILRGDDSPTLLHVMFLIPT